MNPIINTFTDEQIDFLEKLAASNPYNWLTIIQTQFIYKNTAASEVVDRVCSQIGEPGKGLLWAVKEVKNALSLSLLEAKCLVDTYQANKQTIETMPRTLCIAKKDCLPYFKKGDCSGH